MPKTPMDYSKTIIYKIVCNDLNVKECYVGHTINMTKRKYSHKSLCHNEKNKDHNLKIYQIIRENGGWENWSMLLVEKFPCKDKHEACKREREVYEELGAKMNMLRPYLTQEERTEYDKQYNKKYGKQYREEHKAEIKQHYQDHKEYHKLYYQDHKEERKKYDKQYREKLKEKIQCEYCAKLLSKSHMPRHIKICKSKPVKNDQNSIIEK